MESELVRKNNPCTTALSYVLSQRNITFDEADVVLKPDTPFMIQLDETRFIFMILLGDEQIALFSFVVDMAVLDTEKKQEVYEHALILNSFKWESDVKFCLDDDKQYLMVWEVLSLYSQEHSHLGAALNESIERLCDICLRLQQTFGVPQPRIQNSE